MKGLYLFVLTDSITLIERKLLHPPRR